MVAEEGVEGGFFSCLQPFNECCFLGVQWAIRANGMAVYHFPDCFQKPGCTSKPDRGVAEDAARSGGMNARSTGIYPAYAPAGAVVATRAPLPAMIWSAAMRPVSAAPFM